MPPYLGMLGGLGVLWAMTDVLHGGELENRELRMRPALRQVNLGGVLFFAGVLLSIGALERPGSCQVRRALSTIYSNRSVRLRTVLAAYSVSSPHSSRTCRCRRHHERLMTHRAFHRQRLWQLIAYSVGTGGSILVIGSSSGVALMGLEKVEFLWYLKNVSASAVIGYLAGLATYVLGTVLAI